MWPWRVKIPTQDLFRMLLLLMLMLRNVLTIVWCRFGSLSLVIKSNFWPDFDHKVWSRFWNWSSGEILKLKFSQYFAADPWLRLYKDYSWSGFWSYVWSRFWSLSVVQMLIFGWDFEVAARSRLWIWNMTKIFFENLWYDPKKLLW